MFSYQHIYHAGNYADILKHITLTLILESLCKKDKPFTIIDSHAGRGIYSLDCEEALKTAEAKDGIEKLFNLSCSLRDGKTDYSSYRHDVPEAVRKFLDLERLYFLKKEYAGSAEIEKTFLRKNDLLNLVEKHPQEAAALKANAKKPFLTESEFSAFVPKETECSGKIIVHERDSYEALKALTPPVIKRGLVLTDPSYETAEDYSKVKETLSLVHKKWNTAVIAVWYPLLTTKQHLLTQMLVGLEDEAKLGANPCDCMKVEFCAKEAGFADGLPDGESKAHMYGSGMFVINPPWQLKEQMDSVVEYLNCMKE